MDKDRALLDRLARALWDHDNMHTTEEWRDMAWDDMGGGDPCDERVEYELRAAAVIPVLREEIAARPKEVRDWAVRQYGSGTALDQDRRMVAAETEAFLSGRTSRETAELSQAAKHAGPVDGPETDRRGGRK